MDCRLPAASAFSRLAPALLALAWLAGGLPGPGAPPLAAQVVAVDPAGADLPPAQRAAIEKARAELEATRGEQEAAFDALETLILELQDDYERLVGGADAASLKHQYVLAVTDALPAAAGRYASEAAQGRLLQRGVRRKLLAESLGPAVGAAAGVDPRFGEWIATALADELSKRESLDGVDADDVLAALNARLGAGRSWWEFWNEELRPGRPEVQRYQRAVAAYEAAGLELNRAQFPERYGPRGEVAPPGMVVVPGGKYTLGPHTGWDRPGRNEAREVALKPFALDRTEVTQRQYALFVNAQALERRAALLPRGWRLDGDGRANVSAEREQHPVVFVSYDQAAAFAAWADKRLPSEDEWEAAAAGPGAWVYPWGNLWMGGRCNGADESGDTLPVESFPGGRASSGAHDLLGNVWEWTATRDDGSPAGELGSGLVNVIIRGGAYNSDRDKLTTRYRWAAPAHETFASPRYVMPIGFRCAKDL